MGDKGEGLGSNGASVRHFRIYSRSEGRCRKDMKRVRGVVASQGEICPANYYCIREYQYNVCRACMCHNGICNVDWGILLCRMIWSSRSNKLKTMPTQVKERIVNIRRYRRRGNGQEYEKGTVIEI